MIGNKKDQMFIKTSDRVHIFFITASYYIEKTIRREKYVPQ